MKNKEFIELSVKKITGNIDDRGLKKLNEWINESIENKREYERIKSIWANTIPEEIPNFPNVDEKWMHLSEKLELYRVQSKGETFSERVIRILNSVFVSPLKPIGALSLIALIVIVGLYLFNNVSTEYQLTEINVPNASTKSITLPDGSNVTINSGSKLKYYNPFKEESRFVELEGEAFFSVSKNETPFIIQTSNAEIKVLGTEFNVWNRTTKTKVVVKNGKVELSSKFSKSQKVTLTKNELSSVIENNPPLTPQKVDSEYLLGWLKSEFVFYKTPLSEIIEDLERHYDISILLEDETRRMQTLTGSFKNESPDSALKMICLALDLTYSKEGKDFIIKQE